VYLFSNQDEYIQFQITFLRIYHVFELCHWPTCTCWPTNCNNTCMHTCKRKFRFFL